MQLCQPDDRDNGSTRRVHGVEVYGARRSSADAESSRPALDVHRLGPLGLRPQAGPTDGDLADLHAASTIGRTSPIQRSSVSSSKGAAISAMKVWKPSAFRSIIIDATCSGV